MTCWRGMLVVAGVSAAVAAGPRSQAAAPVDFPRLLDEMTDLTHLARWPDPAWRLVQFSSYDRRSRSPADAEGWFANADAGHFLRQMRVGGHTEYVLAECDGPGAVVRIWSANPAGTLRIYLDHAQRPVIEAPMRELLGGKTAGIPPPIAGQRALGWNLYLPIPFARHLRITSDAGGFYYHVDVRRYEKTARLRSFRRDDLRRYARQVRRVAELLTCREPPVCFRAAPIVCGYRGPVEADGSEGHEFALADVGPAAVRRIRVSWDEGAEADLRGLILTLSFDGEPTVVVPLVGLFACGPDVAAVTALPVRVRPAEREMVCYWPMPFRTSVRGTIRTAGARTVGIELDLEIQPWVFDERTMYFHAGLRAIYDVPTRPLRDFNYVTIEGRGVYVGTALTVANPVRNWWGEGDEKIYVDDDRFPSIFGTGTEDYFGYAWCSNRVFQHAYHNQPRCDGPENYGITCVDRWHVLDAIVFRQRLKFDMELWHHVADARVSHQVVSYWYARPGARANTPRVVERLDYRPLHLPPYQPPRVAGAIEGEQMRVLACDGTATPQTISGCSNDQHLWWRDAPGPGARLRLAFRVPAAGRYRVVARFLMAPDYGITRLKINGAPAGAPVDLYADGIRVSDERALGVFELRGGENTLEAEVVGTNPKAIRRFMFGLDYLRLEPVTRE